MFGRSVLAAVIAGLLVAPAGAEEIQKEYHETFPAQEGTRLDLRHGDGDVTVQVWDKNEVQIDVRYHASVRAVGAAKTAEFVVDFRTDGDTIHVTERGGGVTFAGVFLSVDTIEHRYEIRMPAYVHVATRGVDGDVHIDGVSGELSCILEDGDIELENVRSPVVKVDLEDGDLRARGLVGRIDLGMADGHAVLDDATGPGGRIELQDGTLEMTRCAGDYTIAATDGDVRLIAHGGRTLRVTVADGDVEVELPAADDLDVEIESEDGDVEVALAKGTSASFLVTTDDGAFRVSHPQLSKFEESDRGAYGEIGGGKGKIRVKCADGSVTLREM